MKDVDMHECDLDLCCEVIMVILLYMCTTIASVSLIQYHWYRVKLYLDPRKKQRWYHGSRFRNILAFASHETPNLNRYRVGIYCLSQSFFE